MDFKKLTEPYFNELYKTLNHFVEIPSVYDESSKSEDMPYGKNIAYCLNEFKKLGEMYGFDFDLDKRYCELSIGNDGPIIEIFGHLDVVPVNKLKDRDMFKIINKDNVIYARGVADDKGPLLAAFYAVKALKDNGLIKDVRIKIFAGGDEERGSSCLHYYVHDKHKEAPKYGFTPDSRFPMVYGEKGIANFTLSSQIKLKHVISIEAGLAPNIVIPKATFKVDNIIEIKDKITIPHEINGDEITFIGKAAHGASPDKGINALILGFKELGRIYNDDFMLNFAKGFTDYQGKSLNAYCYGEHLKNSIYNLGLAIYKNDVFEVKINSRLPENVEIKKIEESVSKSLKMTIIKTDYDPHLLHDLSSNLVTCLLDAYQKETGDYTNKPSISAGGTYAKEVKNTIAYGVEMPGEDLQMHQDNEYISLNALKTAMAIYAHAIYNLIQVK